MTESAPLELVFLWHMHQPDYRDRRHDRYVLPWTYLHGTKDYTDMADHLERHPGMRAVVNFVPILLQQLEDYARAIARGEPRDPLLQLLAREDFATLTEAQWAAPMSASDPLLQSVLKDHAEQLLRGLPNLQDPLADVQQVLLEAMPRGRVDLEHVAKQLGVSARTLQRRLADTGTRWSELLEEARRQLSARLLVDPSLSVDDVAVLLGYAEASAFHRAFRRWTGQTPGAFRKRHRPLHAGA